MKSFKTINESLEYMPKKLLHSRTTAVLEEGEYPLSDSKSSSFQRVHVHKFDPDRFDDAEDDAAREQQMDYHYYGPNANQTESRLKELGWKRHHVADVYHEHHGGEYISEAWSHPSGAFMNKVSIIGGEEPNHSWHLRGGKE